MKRHALSLAGVLLASYALAACGRSELDVPEDVPDAHVVVDVPLDRPDTPPVDRPDVPDTEPSCTNDFQCNDGLSCNGAEVCLQGRCAPGPALACNDNVVCTVDQCVEGRGCVFSPDNSRCFAPAFCDPMRDCTPVECTSDANCDNGDPCDGAESCRAGRCARGPALTCDDGVACTIDLCLPGRGCLNRVDDTRCNDGLFCNGVERCDARRGCFSEMPVLCDDGDPCTSDRCDEGRRTCITAPTDGDGDGFGPVTCAGGRDCNDADRTVNPGAPELCNDGRDNNCDGRSDCADVTCAGTPACGPCVPTGPEVCGDGRDNDCDRLLDCADSECAMSPACMMCIPTGPEFDPMRCADGIDNDCNGVRDCADANCRFLPGCMMCVPDSRIEICGDGRDNDCNGARDCADGACRDTDACRVVNDTCASPTLLSVPGRASGDTSRARDDFTPTCAGTGAPDVVYVIRNPTRQTITIDTLGSAYDTALIVFRDMCGGTPIACDDDGAGVGTASRIVLTNAEPGTYFIVVDGWNGASGAFQLNVNVGATEVCTNRLDDDGDGLIDCLDRADCATNPFCLMCMPDRPERDPMACLDGRDNDCDGLFDCADPECVAGGFCGCVSTPEACGDGRDNDCDGFIDCSDFDCRGNPACMMCVPTGPEFDNASCSDGRDNDCNGRTDCTDPRCATLPVCAPSPVNDTCAGAIRVGLPSTTRGNLNGARNDFTPVLGAPGCAGGSGGDVVYTLQVSAPTVITIDTVGSTFDTVLYVRREPCETGTQLACNDDSGGTVSRVTFAATRGTYFIFVDGFNEGARGDFVLNITESAGTEICDNARDDDGDGAVDCADAECAMFPSCRCMPVLENNDRACSDRIDNDCDGQSDCADVDCAASRVCCRPTGAEADARSCFDGLDNDCDGLRDCADPGCAAQPMCCRPTMMRETGVGACTDGVDNDCDGVSDCADSDCRPTSVPGGECCNGIDDNGNTIIDEFACACETNAQCAGVGSGGRFPSTACWNTTFRVCAPRCDLLGGNLFCSNFFAGTRCNVMTGECVR